MGAKCGSNPEVLARESCRWTAPNCCSGLKMTRRKEKRGPGLPGGLPPANTGNLKRICCFLFIPLSFERKLSKYIRFQRMKIFKSSGLQLSKFLIIRQTSVRLFPPRDIPSNRIPSSLIPHNGQIWAGIFLKIFRSLAMNKVIKPVAKELLTLLHQQLEFTLFANLNTITTYWITTSQHCDVGGRLRAALFKIAFSLLLKAVISWSALPERVTCDLPHICVTFTKVDRQFRSSLGSNPRLNLAAACPWVN